MREGKGKGGIGKGKGRGREEGKERGGVCPTNQKIVPVFLTMCIRYVMLTGRKLNTLLFTFCTCI